MTDIIPEESAHFRFAKAEQEELCRGLAEVSPGLGDFFRDACQLMAQQGEPLSSRTHLIGHLLREVNGALIGVLWSEDEASPRNQCCRGGRPGEGEKLRSALAFLGIEEGSDLAKRWKALLKSDNGTALNAKAHRAGLGRPRPFSDKFEHEFDEVVAIWTEVVARYRARFLKVLDFIDSVVGLPDPPTDLSARVPKNFVAYKYLFEQLTNPRWLAPLKKHNFFRDPPGLEVNEGGGIRAEVWPQADYLGRMARCDDPSVRGIALEIMLEAASTDNYLIHEAFTETALLMPADLAAKWAVRETAALSSWNVLPFGLMHDLGKLGSRLAGEGHLDAAIALFSEVLDVLPEQEEKAGRPKSDEGNAEFAYRPRPEPRFRSDQHSYKEILESSLPRFVSAHPERTLMMLCRLLERAINASEREGVSAKPGLLTSLSRPAIEDHGQNFDHRVADPLISAVRDAASAVCGQSPEKVQSVVTMLESHGWDIFKRIGLHLLAVAEAPPIELVEERLTDPDQFDYIGVNHEYFHLLRKRFPELSPGGQAKILGWIDSGEHHKAYLDKHEHEWSAEQRTGNLRYWQYTKLLCIEEHLQGEHARRLEELRREFGEPAIPPDFHSWHGGVRMLGQQSPKSTEDLSLLSVEELVAFLKSWKAPGDFDGPSPEGLGSKIEALIAGGPEKYVAGIKSFENEALAPIYLGYLVAGFAKALQNGMAFPFEPLLALCSWLVDFSETARRQAAGDPEGRRDEWARPRHDIARLLPGLFDDRHGFPIALREAVWRVIEPLTNDPDPDLAYETKYGGDNMRPLSISINSIRGNAMHGVIHYALWVCRRSEIDADTGEKRRLSLEDMPEVRAVLDAHLDPGKSQFALNQTDRAVYGDWLPQLMYIDEEWVRVNLGRIFPDSPKERHLRYAAWNTYVVYVHQIYKQVYDLIREVYCEELRRLATEGSKERSYDDPAQKLGEHAVVIYVRGWDDLAAGSLVDLFFASAPEELRAHVLGFLGRDLRKDNPLGDDTVARFKALWQWRVDALTAAGKLSEKELGKFGWWFASGRCGDNWAFHHLEKVLERTGALSGDSDVFERVSQVFEGHQRESLRCLKLFVEKNPNPWFFNLERRGGTREILRKGLASEDAMIRDAAEEIVNLLGSKDYLKFRDLLRKNPGAQE